MVDKTKVTLGLILMTILVSGVIYLQFDDIKIRIDEDKTTFYTLQNSRWVVSGRERTQLFDGTSLMYRDAQNINITYSIKGNTTLIKRITPYIRGPTVIDEYFFDGNNDNIELVPVTHTITILNAKSKFLRYEAYDLIYDGDREKLDGLRKDFGNNMSIEWQEANKRWAWVYINGKLKVQFDIPSDNESYSIRMFDPILEETITNDTEVILKDYDSVYKTYNRTVIDKQTEICTPTIDAKNASHTEDCITETTYKIEEYQVKVDNVVLFEEKEYPNSNVNEKDGYLYVCDVPVGDRNWEEYPMRQYEIDKGVCRKVNLLK